MKGSEDGAEPKDGQVTGRIRVGSENNGAGNRAGTQLEAGRSAGDTEHGSALQVLEPERAETNEGHRVERTLDQPAAAARAADGGDKHAAAAVKKRTGNRRPLAREPERKRSPVRGEGLELHSSGDSLPRRGEPIEHSAGRGTGEGRRAVEAEGVGGRDPADRGRNRLTRRDDATVDGQVTIRRSVWRNAFRHRPESRGTRMRKDRGPRRDPRPKRRRRARPTDQGVDMTDKVGSGQLGAATAAAAADLGAIAGGEPAGVLTDPGHGTRPVPLATDAPPSWKDRDSVLETGPGQSFCHDERLSCEAAVNREDRADADETAGANRPKAKTESDLVTSATDRRRRQAARPETSRQRCCA